MKLDLKMNKWMFVAIIAVVAIVIGSVLSFIGSNFWSLLIIGVMLWIGYEILLRNRKS